MISSKYENSLAVNNKHVYSQKININFITIDFIKHLLKFLSK